MKPKQVYKINAIAIDKSKKDSFNKIHEENKVALKEQKEVTEQAVLPEEPIDFGNQMAQNSTPITNADILSQSFNTPIVEPTQSNTTNPSLDSAPSLDPNLMEIMYDIAEIHDKLDRIVPKVIKLFPDKELVNQEISQNSNTNNMFEINTPIQENPIVNEPQKFLEQNQFQEITPFVPGSANIFDEPQNFKKAS